MTMYAPLRLKKDEQRRLLAGHLWIYSNEIDVKATPLTQFAPGQIVQVQTNTGKPLGIGYINPKTLLCARLLTRDHNESIDGQFFVNRIKQALLLRNNLFTKPYYRLIYGESDGLPGVIIDRYDDILVVQITTYGMEQLLQEVIDALHVVIKPSAILLRNDSAIRQLEGLPSYINPIVGKIPEIITLEENDILFQTSLQQGQKTGWFYDHRCNRAELKKYVANKRVLDVFSYLGGFGIHAAVYGAKEVVCIDSSATAIETIKRNAQLNHVENKIHTVQGDAFEQLANLIKKNGQDALFDVIILDPPAFIKKRKDLKEGLFAYQRLNELALRLLVKSGVLITASCSLHLSLDMLFDVVRRASIKTQRDVKILHQGFQGPDHPIHPAIAETAYLKALCCYVE